ALALFDDLTRQNISFIVLKGNAIAEEIYDDADYKQMNDFDLLFRRQDLHRLAQVYLDFPLQSAAQLGENFRSQEKYSHHWPLFFSPDLKLFIGTHWNIVAPSRNINFPEKWL